MMPEDVENYSTIRGLRLNIVEALISDLPGIHTHTKTFPITGDVFFLPRKRMPGHKAASIFMEPDQSAVGAMARLAVVA